MFLIQTIAVESLQVKSKSNIEGLFSLFGKIMIMCNLIPVLIKRTFWVYVLFQIILLVHLMSSGIIRSHDCHKLHAILK